MMADIQSRWKIISNDKFALFLVCQLYIHNWMMHVHCNVYGVVGLQS